VIFAYEPVWAIGTNNPSSLEHLESILAWLSSYLNPLHTHLTFKIIYGGSISSKNIENFKKISLLDGFLIGTASLSFHELKKIVS
ncbi:MAG TPA: triose-phosphate isomerase, partial [Candidatus Babeliales bacterium]|nr:triose-phosphate isomerase [Candidatus Babeliales bacterium]